MDIQIKRGIGAALSGVDPVFDAGALVLETDTLKLKAGDGNLSYSNLPILFSGIYQPLLINPVTGIGVSGYVPRWNNATSLTSGIIFDNGTNVGVGTSSPSGTFDVAGNLVFNTFTEKVITNTNSGSGITLNINNGTIHRITLTNNCVFTMPTLDAGKSFSIFLNTGSGNYAASFSGVLWNYSSAPTITTAANKVDILSFISDGTYWYGSYSQNYG